MSAHLRIWTQSESEEVSVSGPSRVTAEITLAEFVELALVPELLAIQRSAATIALYRDAARWWSRLTPDPPVGSIDTAAVASFRERLSESHYRRGPTSPWRPLSPWSQAKILRTLRAIVTRLGPGTAARPGEDLLRRMPRMEIRPPRTRAKVVLSVEQARAVIAATSAAEAPLLADCSPGDWWQAFLALAAYTGLRKGTLLSLRWRHLVRRDDGWWLDIEGDAVSKTRRDTRAALHRLAVEALERLPRGEPESLILPWPLRRRSGAKTHDPASAIRKQHDVILAAAGVPRCDIHGWRRWHASQLVSLGYDAIVEVARQSLGHSSSAITLGHYAGASALAVARKLPDLW